ncbi:MAG: AAA family ATPase [Agathobacter sp.]|nr:AAA family ATPase [Agathobacter sp.]
MSKLNLEQFIKLSDDVCNDISRANVANVAAERETLKETFHYELLKFAIFLADADEEIDDNEIGIIRTNLDDKITIERLEAIKKCERIDDRFSTQVPSCLKYAVLADAGRKLNPDPYKGQKAMIIYDTFRLFGQTMLSTREQEVSDVTVLRFTLYMERLEKFIKELAVWYAGEQKINHAIEPIACDNETEEEKAAKLEELMEDLNSLTGLTAVKSQVNSLINLIRVQKMREEKGMKTSDVSKHMVFMGNPGTGKTTVARKLAEIYKYIGVVKTGQLVEVDRSGLVRGYVGQTATRVQEVVEEALGGILFVDEAYTLTVGKGEGDFGQEAVDTLLKAMEDHRQDLIVIVAGYSDLMDQFLESNPGLRSRFSNFILFEDYTAEEMMEIFKNNLKSQDYKLSKEAEKKAAKMMKERVENKPDNFANARDVRNFMEHAISNQATRIVSLEGDDQSKEVLATIEACDLQDFE